MIFEICCRRKLDERINGKRGGAAKSGRGRDNIGCRKKNIGSEGIRRREKKKPN